jgi:hypothetical protein
MYNTKRRFRRSKKRVHKHKKSQKIQNGGFGLLFDVSLDDFILTGYLEAKYALEKYPPDRWPDAFKIKQPDIDIDVKFSDQKEEQSKKLQNIFNHNIAKIKEAYKAFYDSKNPKPMVKKRKPELPIKSFMVKQLLEPVVYQEKEVAAILSPTDFNEVIDYVSSQQIYKKSFGVKNDTNNKYLLFGPSFDEFVQSRDDLKKMVPATKDELERLTLVNGIVSFIKSRKSALINAAEDSVKNVTGFGSSLIRKGAIMAAKQVANAFPEETSVYENYNNRRKMIIDLCGGINSTDPLVNILLTNPKAAFQTVRTNGKIIYTPNPPAKPMIATSSPITPAPAPAANPKTPAANPKTPAANPNTPAANIVNKP